MFVPDVVKQQLAPTGILRAGINLSNFLLVSGTAVDGTPQGISPDIANLVATTLGLPCELVCFDRPGKLADAVNRDIGDIGNIAFEAERAQTLDFSHPYVVIEANFLVRHDDDFLTNQNVDRAGTRIVVSERIAYDLWLTDHFSQAHIIRASSIQAAHDLFLDKKANVLASLKPKLLEEVANHSGLRMMPPFTSVKQSIGLAKGKAESIAFINTLIAQSIKNGWIAAQLELHGMTGKLGIDPH